MDTLSYWLARLKPLIQADDPREVIVVLANRTGVEDDAVYAGTTIVLGIGSGDVKIYGVLGRGEQDLLEADTSKPRGKITFG
jgi:protein N-terminal amidase